jgi:TonB-dependent SusC/RagA subfamily outer membrane receptor
MVHKSAPILSARSIRSAQRLLKTKPSVNLTQALQGTSPNLIIQQTNSEPGAYQNINIRGVSTLGDNSPLVVIDGITGGDINLLNPQDIESVSVLKDAGSAAIYGSRSANGVILVTTKKGKKNSVPTLTYNGQAVYRSHMWVTSLFIAMKMPSSGTRPW